MVWRGEVWVGGGGELPTGLGVVGGLGGELWLGEQAVSDAGLECVAGRGAVRLVACRSPVNRGGWG